MANAVLNRDGIDTHVQFQSIRSLVFRETLRQTIRAFENLNNVEALRKPHVDECH